MAYLVLDQGRRLAYAQLAGKPGRPWLVFLHEGLGSMAQWGDFPEQLCGRCQCPGLLYDRLGYGRSDPEPLPRTIHYLHRAALIELPALLAAAIPGEPYILIGHSDGGSISLMHAAERPPHLLGGITEAAHVFVEAETLAGIGVARAAWKRGRLGSLARFHGEKTDSLFHAWADTWESPAFASWNIEYLLPSIEAPLLVLQGQNDRYGTPAQVETIVARSSGPATPLFLEDCGHCPHGEFPELTLDLMSCFINRLAR